MLQPLGEVWDANGDEVKDYFASSEQRMKIGYATLAAFGGKRAVGASHLHCMPHACLIPCMPYTMRITRTMCTHHQVAEQNVRRRQQEEENTPHGALPTMPMPYHPAQCPTTPHGALP